MLALVYVHFYIYFTSKIVCVYVCVRVNICTHVQLPKEARAVVVPSGELTSGCVSP